LGKFAFIVHPHTLKQIKKTWPIIRNVPDSIIKSSLKSFPAFRVLEVKSVRSGQGNQAQGYFIALPLLPQQMLESKQKRIIDKIMSAGYLAERLGAQILGLGGYTSIVGNEGYTIAQRLKIPVTTGSTLIAWSIFEAIFRLARVKNKDLKQSNLAVIGAAGAVSSLCARKFSDLVGRIIISAKDQAKAESLRKDVLELNPVDVVIEPDVHQAVKDADIVVITMNTPEVAALAIEELKPESIVCDAAIPKDISARSNPRRDITIIKGGLIKLPHPVISSIATGLPEDFIYADMAETMLLALEGRLANYSLGDDINLDKMDEIADLAVKHGFEVWVPEAPVL
jgi:predicted amino acid dehydrogenase